MDDVYILKQIKTGDTGAIGKLYERYHKKGTSISKQYVKSRDEAEDMFQEAFLKAIINTDKIAPESDQSQWFEAILVDTCRNYLVKKDKISLPEIQDDGTVPELSFDRKELMSIVRGSIEELPQPQQHAMMLFHQKGMSVKEIAQQLNIPEQIVNTRLNYSNRKIDESVRGYEEKTGNDLNSAALIPAIMTIIYKSSDLEAGENIPAGVNDADVPDESNLRSQVINILKIVIPIVALALIGLFAYKIYNDRKEVSLVEQPVQKNESIEPVEDKPSESEAPVIEEVEEVEEPTTRTVLEEADFTDDFINKLNEKGKEEIKKEFNERCHDTQYISTMRTLAGVDLSGVETAGEITGDPVLLKIDVGNSRNSEENLIILYYEVPGDIFIEEDANRKYLIHGSLYMVSLFANAEIKSNGEFFEGEHFDSALTDERDNFANVRKSTEEAFSFFSVPVNESDDMIDELLLESFNSREHDPTGKYAFCDVNGDGQNEMLVSSYYNTWISEIIWIKDGLDYYVVMNSPDHDSYDSYISKDNKLIVTNEDEENRTIIRVFNIGEPGEVELILILGKTEDMEVFYKNDHPNPDDTDLDKCEKISEEEFSKLLDPLFGDDHIKWENIQ